MTLTRREFLAASNAAALLLLLESCSLGPLGSSGGGSGQKPSSLIKQALIDLRDALRASPDHLAFRAADVAATKDATKIVNLVRDSLSVIPPWGGSDDPTAIRWGSAAALRGGQGTLRERADILAGLLSKAGFNATVMAAALPTGIGVSQLYRQRSANFAPTKGKVDDARSLLRQAGLPAPLAQHAFDPGPDPVAAILAALPADVEQARVRQDLLPQTVPVVEFTDHGNKRYAFALGDLGITDTPPAGLISAGGTGDTPVMTVTVSALPQPAPGSTTVGGRLVDLVSGSWRLDKLAGRQVLLMFAPPEGPSAILGSGLVSLPVRIPLLRVQTGGTNPDPSLVAAGSLVTVHGDVLGPSTAPAPSPGTSATGPFGSLLNLSDSDRAAAQGRVASIKVSANPTAFPEIELVMDLADSSGASVDGLDARSFTMQEQGSPIGAFSVYSNARKQLKPRVLVVYDSYPDWWPSSAAKSKFDAALANALAVQARKTPFDVQVVGLGATPSEGAWTAPDAGKLTVQFGAQFESADDPWFTVGGPALDQGVNAFIVVSDFNNLDSDANKVPTYQHRVIGRRVPVYAVPSGQSNGAFNGAVAAEVVKVSGGASFDAKDASTPTKIAAAVALAIGTWVSTSYRVRYHAATGDPKQRAVTLGITGRSQPTGTATYVIPDKPIPPPAFAGLYVRIEGAGLQSIRRLAGVEINYRGAPLGDAADAGAIAETRAALDGITTIAFEPGSPTSAAILDDVVDSLLSVMPLTDVPQGAPTNQVLKAVPNGVRRVPVALASLLRPTDVDPAALAGLKVMILQDRVLDAASSEQHADLAIGANPVVPITPDPVAAFKAALKTSVAACAAEAATYANSAYAKLEGATLVPLRANDYAARDAWLNSLAADQKALWSAAIFVYDGYHRVVPKDGQAGAMWVVDPDTGVAKASLPDSTGGGVSLMKCTYDSFDQAGIALAILSIMCSGPISNYSLYCVGINTAATGMAVVSLFNSHWDPGTPVSIALGVIQPELTAGTSASIGVYLLIITLQTNCGK